jgi:hypothetical protein
MVWQIQGTHQQLSRRRRHRHETGRTRSGRPPQVRNQPSNPPSAAMNASPTFLPYLCTASRRCAAQSRVQPGLDRPRPVSVHLVCRQKRGGSAFGGLRRAIRRRLRTGPSDHRGLGRQGQTLPALARQLPKDLPQALIPAFPGAEGRRHVLIWRAAEEKSSWSRASMIRVLALCAKRWNPGGPRIIIFNVAGIIRSEESHPRACALRHPRREHGAWRRGVRRRRHRGT